MRDPTTRPCSIGNYCRRLAGLRGAGRCRRRAWLRRTARLSSARCRESCAMTRVLVVDDDPTVREVVISYLKAEQYDVARGSRRRDRAVDDRQRAAGSRGARRDAARRRRSGGLPAGPRDDRRPDHHAHRARRGVRSGRRSRAGRRRLRDQAVQPARAGAAGVVGAAPGRARRPAPDERVLVDGDLRDRRAEPTGDARRASRSR